VNGRKQGTDINLYKLFLEQCFNLLRDGGRCGIILPGGIYTDLGAKQLREMLFSQCRLDSLFGLSNEKFIFEGVHHSFKFSLLSFEKGGETNEFSAVFRINPREAVRSSELGQFLYDRSQQLKIPVSLVQQLSPDSLSVMEFKQAIDIQIAKKMAQYPLLGDRLEDTWNLKLTAEFHMTNDSHLFKTEPAPGRLPLYEGKMIHQFTHQWGQPKYWLDETDVRKKLIKRGEVDTNQTLSYQIHKLGFRDIASSTNERTAIATMLPKGVCCNHKIPTVTIRNCEQEICYVSELLFCAFLNSFVVDYVLRQRVTTNLTFFFLYQLPVPRLQKGDRWFDEIVHHAARLICTTPDYDNLAQEIGLENHKNGAIDETERAYHRAQLDGIIAHLYHLTETEFAHILSTFPIVPDTTKHAAIDAYRAINQQQ
jgi:hypothetical protein